MIIVLCKPPWETYCDINRYTMKMKVCEVMKDGAMTSRLILGDSLGVSQNSGGPNVLKTSGTDVFFGNCGFRGREFCVKRMYCWLILFQRWIWTRSLQDTQKNTISATMLPNG